MESTTNDQKFFATGASLSEPHFDEEATVLSARPVVPLTTLEDTKTVPAGTAFPRPWVLGLALAGTLLLGVVGTAYYYSRSDINDSGPFSDVEVAASGEAIPVQSEGFAGSTSVQPTASNAPPAEVRRTEPVRSQPVQTIQPVHPSTTAPRKPAPRLVAVYREKGNRGESSESLEERKAERKQENQERRRAEREKRRSSDDVLRIRDIFEGSPRP